MYVILMKKKFWCVDVDIWIFDILVLVYEVCGEMIVVMLIMFIEGKIYYRYNRYDLYFCRLEYMIVYIWIKCVILIIEWFNFLYMIFMEVIFI